MRARQTPNNLRLVRRAMLRRARPAILVTTEAPIRTASERPEESRERRERGRARQSEAQALMGMTNMQSVIIPT